jgi:hypothetical protein
MKPAGYSAIALELLSRLNSAPKQKYYSIKWFYNR